MATEQRLYTPEEAITYIAGASAQEHRRQTTKQLPKANHPLTLDDLAEIAAAVGVNKNQLESYIHQQELSKEQATKTWNQLDITPSNQQRTQLATHYINALHEQLAQTYPTNTFLQQKESVAYGVNNTLYEQHPKKLFGLLTNNQPIANINISNQQPNITVHDERFLIACTNKIQELHQELTPYLNKPRITSHTTPPALKQ